MEELARQDMMEGVGEISAQALSEDLSSRALDAQREDELERREEQEELMLSLREGIGELFEDGWTAQELAAFAGDPHVREAIAKGHGVARAACAYLKEKLKSRRHGVPTARVSAAGAYMQENPIDGMTDEQFDAFSKKAQAAMMAGQKVRL